MQTSLHAAPPEQVVRHVILDYFFLLHCAYDSTLYGQKFHLFPSFPGNAILPVPLQKKDAKRCEYATSFHRKATKAGAKFLSTEDDLEEISALPWCAATIAVEDHLVTLKKSRTHLNQLDLYVEGFLVITSAQMTKVRDAFTAEAKVKAAEQMQDHEDADCDSAEESEEITQAQEYVGDLPFSYKHVRWWTRNLRIPLLNHHVVLAPVNYPEVHWGLLGLVNTFHRRKTIHEKVYMDSLHWTGKKKKKLLQRYCEEEYSDKAQLYESKSKIKRLFKDMEVAVPYQHNGCDCGVWVCIFAYCIIRGIDPCKFDGKNKTEQEQRTLWFRKHMYASIISGNIMPVVTYPQTLPY